MMTEVSQYGLAAVVTLLLLREVFAFVLKMRAKVNCDTITACAFNDHAKDVARVLGEVRDGVNKLVILAEDGRRLT